MAFLADLLLSICTMPDFEREIFIYNFLLDIRKVLNCLLKALETRIY